MSTVSASFASVSSEHSSSVEADFIRLVLFALGNSTAPCVVLRMPSQYAVAALAAARSAYPTYRSLVIETYCGSTKVMLWNVPE